MVTSESEFESDLSDNDIEDGVFANTMNGIYDDEEDEDNDDDPDYDDIEEGIFDNTMNGIYDNEEDEDNDDDPDDDDIEEGIFDNIMNGIYDNDEDEGNDDDPDYDDMEEGVFGNIMNNFYGDDGDVDDNSNFNMFDDDDSSTTDSEPYPSINSNSSGPFVDDSLRMYLTAPPLIRKVVNTDKHCLSIDPTIDESTSGSLSTSVLYVGNVPYNAKWYELKNWFIELGYGVSRVDLKTNKKGGRYAFVRFDSISIATYVLHKSERRERNFVFQGNTLYIKRGKGSPQKPITTPLTTTTSNNTLTPADFQISDIHYGMLITRAAMKNIQRGNNIISNDEFGIIAHNLMNSDEYKTSFTFNIDTANKKLAIIGKFDSSMTFISELTEALKFEWNFRDLKAKKITPVLINQNEIYLLIEIRQPPIILETEDEHSMGYDTTKETRLPGNPLIGHANVWLFKLSSHDLDQDYRKLFDILRQHNLSDKKFSDSNIIHLIRAATNNLESIQLISNDEWVNKNQDRVDDFFNRQWSPYPFETKFEIMKLISKHIITVHDLIVDEKAEDILKLCTINTLIALTDKIVELAPRWFSRICDNEDEDWDKENKQEQQQAEPEDDNLPTNTEDVLTTIDDSGISLYIRSSATGASINTENTEMSSITTETERDSTKHHPGTFSRLLIYALKQLLKKSQLYRTATSNVYITKLEFRTANANPFLIRKIYITPSTILYEGPYREEKCAVTRKYVEHQDRFLRVTFRDEDYRVLHNYNDNMSKMYERIKNILINGVNVCGRNYQFLAFSSSQLREHSCWMFASINNGTTVDTIRQWMGDFQNVHPVAKFAARLGQSFSTSIEGIELESRQFMEISDYKVTEEINGRLREHCFTDGIGIISPKFAKQLANQMNLSDKKSFPSAFQIRCGGYKGMLCVDIFNVIKSPDIDVHFRPSMNKFIATNFSIDVVRTSLNPSVAFLNRQIILLLSSLGIRNQTFISLQNDMLRQLKALTGNSQAACDALKELNEFGGNGYHGFLIKYLRNLGERKDPFVRRLLLAFKAFLIKEIRTKAKIRVPNSWSLLGVIDESGTLQYGQVFIQIDNSNQQREDPIREIFKGPVVVTRNPCFHPGDIRKLEAVDIPAFHKLKNVIVFPKNGPRPHAKEMSGGDLDGDTFWISRHRDLIFQSNEEPFDYQEQEDEAKDNQPQINVPHTIKEVCNFFGEYIAADNLGLIANSHLVFADQLENGSKDEKCLKLARMHSVAVDFAKNGVSAPRLIRELRPEQYPHYMEKSDKVTYQSKTILGILYDEIKSYSIDLNINEQEEITATLSFPYKSFFINDIDSYIKDARIIKSEYDRDIKRVMQQYGIRHEAEIVSGYILKFTSKQYAKDTKLFELRKEISHAYKVIQDKYLRLFWQEFYQSTDDSQEEENKWPEISKKLNWKNQLDVFEWNDRTESDEEVQKKGSAWFRITYEPWMKYVEKSRRSKKKNQNRSVNNQQAEHQQRFKGLFSFAWLVYPVLLEIFKEKEKDEKSNIESKKKKKKKNEKKKKDSSISPSKKNG